MLKLCGCMALAICAWGVPAALAGADDAPSAQLSIVPQPMEVHRLPGTFDITGSTVVAYDSNANGVESVAEYLATHLREKTGFGLPLVATAGSSGPPSDAITLALADVGSALGTEGYILRVTPSALTLTADRPEGLFRGVQTIRQMLPMTASADQAADTREETVWCIPCVRIRDMPRFRWRGMLLDCGRHFMPVAFIKRYIDLLAYHKMNVLHWHLTEDQGWRIEIKKYPRLTEIGAWRTPTRDSEQPTRAGRYGGYYTQEEVRKIVAYAQSRFVTVVPEIEMPGHCAAALASYPELGCTGGPYDVGTRWGVYDDVYCAGNGKVFKFLEDVLTEVIALFPSPYIHIGGDECPKTRWKACPKCQARIREEGLRDEHELQSYFIRRMERFLNREGRRIIGWDEIIEGGLAPDATVQSWRGMDGAVAAARAGHDVIVSPTSHCYLDYTHEAISLERIYSFEPVPEELSTDQARHILGAEGNVWTERAPPEVVDRQVFPRLCALAEVTWSPVAARHWGRFCHRMKSHYARLDALGVAYFLLPPRRTSGDLVFEQDTTMTLENPLRRGVIRYTLDGREPTAEATSYVGPVRITHSTVAKARTYLPDGRASGVATLRFRKLSPLEPTEVPAAQPGLVCSSYEGHWQRLPDFSKLTPAETGVATTLTLDPRGRDDSFALRFSGFLHVPADGVYTFYLTSDDGSRLWIGGDLVVDHDGLHSASEASGQLILKAGRHPISVAYFEAGGSEFLEVVYEGPGIAKQPIPPSVLWHGATE